MAKQKKSPKQAPALTEEQIEALELEFGTLAICENRVDYFSPEEEMEIGLSGPITGPGSTLHDMAAVGAKTYDLRWLGHDSPEEMFDAMGRKADELMAKAKTGTKEKQWEAQTAKFSVRMLRDAYAHLTKGRGGVPHEFIDWLFAAAYRAGALGLGSDMATKHRMAPKPLAISEHNSVAAEGRVKQRADDDAEEIKKQKDVIRTCAEKNRGQAITALSKAARVKSFARKKKVEVGDIRILKLIHEMLLDPEDKLREYICPKSLARWKEKYGVT